MPYILECGCCGEPVKLSAKRYTELFDKGEKPLCRTNGCAQMAGFAVESTADDPSDIADDEENGVYRTGTPGLVLEVKEGDTFAQGKLRRRRIR